MGQAKNRGSQIERIEQAKLAKEKLRPEFIVCNECGDHITDIHELNSKGLRGINAVFAGQCQCGRATFAISGDQEAAAELLLSLQDQFGHGSKVGIQNSKS